MNSIQLPFGLGALQGIDFPRKLGVMERLYGSSLEPHGVCWVRCASGVTWKLDLTDPTHRWIVYGDYEGSSQMNWIRRWLSGGGVVVDSGANIGQMCQYFAQMPGVNVLCFEPLPDAYNWIKECLDQYPSWKVSLHPFGLSDQATTITVQAHGARTTARLDWYQGINLAKVDINVVPLDDFARDQHLDSIRLWKLDVEGHELAALKGARELLVSKRIEALLVEVSSDEVISFLADVGYETFLVGSSGALQSTPGWGVRGNLIALPSK